MVVCICISTVYQLPLILTAVLHVDLINVAYLTACAFIFVFVALRPMSTAMVIAGRSVHLTTLFPGQA